MRFLGFSAIFGVSKVPLIGISVLVQRFRNLCARDVVIPVVGVLCRSSNASSGFNAAFSVFFNNVFSQQIQISHCSGGDEVNIWSV